MMLTDKQLFERLRAAIRQGWIPVPAGPGYGGSGGAGRLLEESLGISGGNMDVPDSGKWELKFHSGNALLTLFHKEGEPRGHMLDIIQQYGWRDAKERLSFRHTLRRESDRGFYVKNEDGLITVRHSDHPDKVLVHWSHDTLINAFAAKFRRMIVVKGRRRRESGADQVRFDSTRAFTEPRTTMFIDAIERGAIAIDFDARTQNGQGLRNHGTKFRISYDSLDQLYQNTEIIT